MQISERSISVRRYAGIGRFVLTAGFALGVAAPALCQPLVPPVTHTISLSGPRFGMTMLPQSIVDKLDEERNIKVTPNISQFGWQFEKQFYSRKEGGLTAISEWVVLAGGMDQGVVLPSVSWLVGVRTREGAEFGIGPNITPAGTALAIAAGVTFRAGALNVPMNVAIVPSKNGTRVSVLTGFSMRSR